MPGGGSFCRRDSSRDKRALAGIDKVEDDADSSGSRDRDDDDAPLIVLFGCVAAFDIFGGFEIVIQYVITASNELRGRKGSGELSLHFLTLTH
jgi:hypothetical protein